MVVAPYSLDCFSMLSYWRAALIREKKFLNALLFWSTRVKLSVRESRFSSGIFYSRFSTDFMVFLSFR